MQVDIISTKINKNLFNSPVETKCGQSPYQVLLGGKKSFEGKFCSSPSKISPDLHVNYNQFNSVWGEIV